MTDKKYDTNVRVDNPNGMRIQPAVLGADIKPPAERPTAKQAKAIIVRRISDGEVLPVICRETGYAYRTVMSWLTRDEEFAAAYEEARVIQAQLWIDEAMGIAATPVVTAEMMADIIEQAAVLAEQRGVRLSQAALNTLAKSAANQEMQRRRMMIDTRRWFASKVARALYGDRLDVDAKVGMAVEVVTQTFTPPEKDVTNQPVMLDHEPE